MPQLLELPTDLLRLILSSHVACSYVSYVPARFVCRRFRELLPREQARYFCQLAAAEGYLGLIKWARANGCPWDADTCANAAEGGHLEVLQWAHANGCPWDENTC